MLALTLAILGAAACGGSSDGDDAAATTIATTPTTSTAPTTTAPATTTPAPATTTTAAPTTTIDPTEALIAEIEADLNAGEQAFLEGAGNPASPESRTNLERYFTEPALSRLIALYDSLSSQGLTARPNPDVASVIVVKSLVEPPSDGIATVEICRIDAGVTIDPLGDGNEAIVNDEIIRYDSRLTITSQDGFWASSDGESLGAQPGATSCDL